MSEAAASAFAIGEDAGYIASGAPRSGQDVNDHVYAWTCLPEGDAQDRVPSSSKRTTGVVLLAPLADERKSSLRPMVEIARALAGAGVAALRIDYRGTGDSGGNARNVSLESMTADAVAAAGWMRDEIGCREVVLVGLRLGAAVAILAAKDARAHALVLVEPVVKGAT